MNENTKKKIRDFITTHPDLMAWVVKILLTSAVVASLFKIMVKKLLGWVK